VDSEGRPPQPHGMILGSLCGLQGHSRRLPNGNRWILSTGHGLLFCNIDQCTVLSGQSLLKQAFAPCSPAAVSLKCDRVDARALLTWRRSTTTATQAAR